jgi:hypothetical protein
MVIGETKLQPQVLQEVAAARQVQIICGSAEVDGHAFCLGLEYLNQALHIPANQVIFLIRGAIFRPRHISRKQERFSLNICSLGELIDMYHGHQASELHDKVYALLGMCLDDLSAAGLAPDYNLQWSQVMQRVVKFLLGDHASVQSWDDKDIAVIRSEGCVLGKVTSTENNVDKGLGNQAEITFKITRELSGSATKNNVRVTLRSTSQIIEDEDLICLLKGTQKPTVIRLHKDYFLLLRLQLSLRSTYRQRTATLSGQNLHDRHPSLVTSSCYGTGASPLTSHRILCNMMPCCEQVSGNNNNVRNQDW